MESFLSNNRENVKTITIENVGRIEQQIRDARNKKVQNGQIHNDQPAAKKQKPAPAPQTADAPKAFSTSQLKESTEEKNAFKSRADKGTAMMTLNGALGKASKFKPSRMEPLGNHAVISLDPNDFEGVMQRYRYMYTHIHDRARSLDKQ